MENNNLKNDRLPFGNAKLVLGISSIVLSSLIIGFILGVISVFLVDKDSKILKQFPENFSSSAISNHKTGTILAWLGFVVSLIVTIVILFFYGKFGTLNFEEIKSVK